MQLLIVAECEHYRVEGRFVAPRHFVREIDLWASMFNSVELLTRFPPWKPKADVMPYASGNVAFIDGSGAFRRSWKDQMSSSVRTSRTVARMIAGFRRADAVHIRCPCRNGLLGLILQRLFRRPCYIKWAGNWCPSPQEPWSSRAQRRLIRRPAEKTVATVYGRLDDDPDHVLETPTTSLSQAEVAAARNHERSEPPDGAVRLLWVGRFSRNKNTLGLLDTMDRIRVSHPTVELHFAGEGPDEAATKEEASRRGMSERVFFHGALPWDELTRLYASSRLLLLPSGTEGFPKVVHEAALFGTPCVVFAAGALPRIVRECGVAVSPVGDMPSFTSAVRELLGDGIRWQELSNRARVWAGSISIESVVDGYRRMIQRSWGITLPEPRFPLAVETSS